jgi:hypothetical protein
VHGDAALIQADRSRRLTFLNDISEDALSIGAEGQLLRGRMFFVVKILPDIDSGKLSNECKKYPNELELIGWIQDRWWLLSVK